MSDHNSENNVALRTVDLTRRYRVGRELISALNNVNINIKKGEFVAIMGPSGSGKSTLLNLLGGLDQPTSGQVLLDHHDLRLGFRSLGQHVQKRIVRERRAVRNVER